MDLSPLIATIGKNYRGSASIDGIKQYISTHELLAQNDSTSLQLESLAQQVQDFCIKTRLPHLIVDWKTLPTLGAQCQPHFLLVLTDEYQIAKPKINISVTPALDFNAENLSPKLRQTTQGQWQWFFPFAVSQNGEDCRPGDYVLSVEINFDRAMNEMPRNLHCDIRLTIPQKHENNRTLEIDANGKSLINLQGMNLSQFGHIKLSGSDLAALNTVDYQSNSAESTENSRLNDSVVHEYGLEYDLYSFAETARLITRNTTPSYTTNASLTVGGKNLLIETRKEITLGRSRNADITLRAMPRSPENDNISRRISRIHAKMTMSDSDFRILRESTKSLIVNSKELEGDRHFEITADTARPREKITIQFDSSHALDLSATPYFDKSTKNSIRTRFIESQRSSIAELNSQSASDRSLNFIHIKRLCNVINEEYFLLNGTIPIGSDFTECGIILENVPSIAAEIFQHQGTFYLCSIDADAPIQVSGINVGPSQVIPLVYDDVIQIGEHKMLFKHFQQLSME